MSNFGQKISMQTSSQNLLQALEETNLALPLGILVAQRQTSLLFKENLEHLKLVSNLYDEACGAPRRPLEQRAWVMPGR